MSPSELRIGNLVEYHDDSTVFEIVEVNLTGLRVKNEEQETWIECDAFSPIPLTEEWLIRSAGFSKSVRPGATDLYKDLTARMVLWFCDSNYAELDLIQDGKRISFKHSHIKFVHQLQNLYFALTNEELKIK